MIEVSIYRDGNFEIDGFAVSGHAGYAKRDEDDIICAAISAIAYTAVGYFDEVRFGNCKPDVVIRDGYMSWKRPEIRDSLHRKQAEAVLEAMTVGFKQIEYSYGCKYIKVNDVGGATPC